MFTKHPIVFAAALSAGALFPNGNVRVFSRDRGLYYGVTFWKGGLWVTARHTQGHHSKTGNHLELYNDKLNLVKRVKTPVQDAHQALARGDYVYIADSAHNLIRRYHPRSNVFDTISWRRTGKDYNHINSLYYDSIDDRMYVLEHNLGTQRKDNSNTSTVVMFEGEFGPRLDEIIDFGKASHNLIRMGNKLITLSSWTKRIIICDLQTLKKHDIVWHEDVWLRGLAFDGEHFFVGGSIQTPRENRHKGDSIIYKCDRNFHVLGERVLKNTGQLCEIRLCIPDPCHTTDHNFTIS